MRRQGWSTGSSDDKISVKLALYADAAHSEIYVMHLGVEDAALDVLAVRRHEQLSPTLPRKLNGLSHQRALSQLAACCTGLTYDPERSVSSSQTSAELSKRSIVVCPW